MSFQRLSGTGLYHVILNDYDLLPWQLSRMEWIHIVYEFMNEVAMGFER